MHLDLKSRGLLYFFIFASKINKTFLSLPHSFRYHIKFRSFWEEGSIFIQAWIERVCAQSKDDETNELNHINPNNMKESFLKLWFLAFLLSVVSVVVSCEKDPKPSPEPLPQPQHDYRWTWAGYYGGTADVTLNLSYENDSHMRIMITSFVPTCEVLMHKNGTFNYAGPYDIVLDGRFYANNDSLYIKYVPPVRPGQEADPIVYEFYEVKYRSYYPPIY